MSLGLKATDLDQGNQKVLTILVYIYTTKSASSFNMSILCCELPIDNYAWIYNLDHRFVVLAIVPISCDNTDF